LFEIAAAGGAEGGEAAAERAHHPPDMLAHHIVADADLAQSRVHVVDEDLGEDDGGPFPRFAERFEAQQDERRHRRDHVEPAVEPLVAAIQPGVDNRESVQGTLGRPTFVGQFDQSDWYYVSRTTRQLAFNMPRPHEQTVLRVHFDASGNVESVTRSGLELVS